MLSTMLGGLVGTMLDPIIFGLGVAAYAIGRVYGWPGMAAAVVVAAVALFTLLSAMSGGELAARVLFAYLAAIAAWTLVSWCTVRVFHVYREAMR